MSEIMKRKVDSKGRVVLLFKNMRDVFIAKMGNVIIASPRKSEIEKILEIIEEYKRKEKNKSHQGLV
ncbi:MAG: hypothetical protein ACTSX9_04890 [Candidatus Njordarchaeales archaeon]